MDGRAKTSEDIMGEIQKLCQLIDEAQTQDTPLKKLNEQLHVQIAEHERSEKKLSEDANLHQSILGAMHSGISIRDLDYTITYQNSVVTKIFGDRTGEKCYQTFEGKKEVCEGCPVELACRVYFGYRRESV